MQQLVTDCLTQAPTSFTLAISHKHDFFYIADRSKYAPVCTLRKVHIVSQQQTVNFTKRQVSVDTT